MISSFNSSPSPPLPPTSSDSSFRIRAQGKLYPSCPSEPPDRSAPPAPAPTTGPCLQSSDLSSSALAPCRRLRPSNSRPADKLVVHLCLLATRHFGNFRLEHWTFSVPTFGTSTPKAPTAASHKKQIMSCIELQFIKFLPTRATKGLALKLARTKPFWALAAVGQRSVPERMRPGRFEA